ncbi:MAG: hypothetical protein K2G70_02315 [Turicibacter sp.]|nr:hypothetical protein [Turicibacter sp.]
MDLSKYDSLRACTKSEVIKSLQQAKQKLEIYVAEIDPESFMNLQLPLQQKVELVMSKKALMIPDEDFVTLFYRVLYDSLQIEIDVSKEKRIKYLKVGFFFSLVISSILFISFSYVQQRAVVLFILVIICCVGLYQLLNHKVDLVVSNIKRRTNFKIMTDDFLEWIPSLYILDEKMYLGSNLFHPKGSMDFYAIDSKSEQYQIQFIYAHYSATHQIISDEWIIGQYFERIHTEELSTMHWQE